MELGYFISTASLVILCILVLLKRILFSLVLELMARPKRATGRLPARALWSRPDACMDANAARPLANAVQTRKLNVNRLQFDPAHVQILTPVS